MDYAKATRAAARVGQILAVGMALWGLHANQYILLFTSLFVWIGAAREAEEVTLRASMRRHAARDAMLTDFRSLEADATAQQAADLIVSSWQTDFPILEGGQIAGILTRHDLIQALANAASPLTSVGAIMRRNVPFCHPDDPLDECLLQLRTSELPVLPVVEHGRLVGLITSENVGEFLLLNAPEQEGAGFRTSRGLRPRMG
jgi:CBS domain-containing protein